MTPNVHLEYQHHIWYKFCSINDADWQSCLTSLAQMTHGHELWKQQNSLLEGFVISVFEACYQQQKLQCFENKDSCTFTAFNTSLVTHGWEDIYGVFGHCSTQAPEWKLLGFLKESDVRAWGFNGPGLERPVFFDDPSAMVLDLRGEIHPNFETLVSSGNASAMLQNIFGAGATDETKLVSLQDAFNRAKLMCRAHYRTPVPQFGFEWDSVTNRLEGRLGFLLPLYITDQPCPDLALMVTRTRESAGSPIPEYVGAELYSAEVGHRNARLLGKVESEWLRTAIAWLQNRARAQLSTTPTQSRPAVQQRSAVLANHNPLFSQSNPHTVYQPSMVKVAPGIHPHVHRSLQLTMDPYTGRPETITPEPDRCYPPTNYLLDNEAVFLTEPMLNCVEPAVYHTPGRIPYFFGHATPPIPSPSSSPSPHCEERPGVVCSCPRPDHYYSIVLLNERQRSYIRYIVVIHPLSPSETYSIGIRYVCESQGVQQLLRILEANTAVQYKKGAQRRLCPSVVDKQFCPKGTMCTEIHVTPEGWDNKRRWVKERQASTAPAQTSSPTPGSGWPGQWGHE